MSLVESLREDIIENNDSLVIPFFSDYASSEIKKLSLNEARQLMHLLKNDFNPLLCLKYCINIVEMNEDFKIIRSNVQGKVPYFPIIASSAIDD